MSKHSLHASLGKLRNRLSPESPELKRLATQRVPVSKLEQWGKNLGSFHDVIKEAKEEQLEMNVGMKRWMDDVQDAGYEVEDVMNEFDNIQASTPTSVSVTAKKRSLKKLIRPFSTVSSPGRVTSDDRLNSKMIDVTRRLEELNKGMDGLGMTRVLGRKAIMSIEKCSPTEASTCRRDEDETKIIAFTADDEDDSDDDGWCRSEFERYQSGTSGFAGEGGVESDEYAAEIDAETDESAYETDDSAW